MWDSHGHFAKKLLNFKVKNEDRVELLFKNINANPTNVRRVPVGFLFKARQTIQQTPNPALLILLLPGQTTYTTKTSPHNTPPVPPPHLQTPFFRSEPRDGPFR